MSNMIRVGMADLNTALAPDALTTLGLGSCVGVSLYDSTTKISGMVHVMLPDSKKFTRVENKAKYADTGIDELLRKMIELGASENRITAKIAGGAQMFAFNLGSDSSSIGERNVIAVKDKLKERNIKIIAEDTGSDYGRTIEFYADTGELKVKSVGREEKII